MTVKFRRTLWVVATLFCLTQSLSATDFNIIIADPAGKGFNDPTPVSPIGGNPGTTLGEQRLNVLRRAMEIWGAHIFSDVTIDVLAEMPEQTCGSGGATLASAGAEDAFINFPNAPLTNTTYGAALANALAGQDNRPGVHDINVNVNINLDANPTCTSLFGSWYYGYDHQNSAGPDLLSTLLHELAHGLGFQSFVDRGTGGQFRGMPDTFSNHIYDSQIQKPWTAMTNTERRNSAINDPHLVWTGPQVTEEAPNLLTRNAALLVKVNAPSPLEGKYEAFGATFGGVVSSDIVAAVVLANTNGCTAITTDLVGKIAMIDRGGCSFASKAIEAQSKGAVAVIIVSNTEAALGPMGTEDNTEGLTIPSVLISNADGVELKAALPLNMTIGLDPEPAGMNAGYVRLHAPRPLAPGSSVSHFTESATPELLMEPNASDDLGDGLDLTLALFKDIGWPMANITNVYRHIYPWLSHNSRFESILVVNNLGGTIADVTLTARRATGDPVVATKQVQPYGFLEETVSELFPTLSEGDGFTVEVSSISPNLAGRWVTESLQSVSQASPAQGEAIALPAADNKCDTKAGSNNILFGYMPNTGNTLSAPAIVNVGSEATAVILYFFDASGELLLTDTTSITNLEPYRPFAATMDTLLGGQKVNTMVVARSLTQPLAGASFIFDSQFLEPAIGSAQAIEFTPPQ